MKLLILLLTTTFLYAQSGVLVEFTHQGSQWGMERYTARICNKQPTAQNFSSVLIRNAAEARGLKPASYSTIEQHRQRENRISPQEILMSVGEASGYVLGTLTATNSVWKDQPAWVKATPLIVSGGVRVAKVILERHTPVAENPPDLIPVNIHLPAGDGECVEYSVFGLGGGG